MKNLMRYLAFALMVGSACAQSDLPPCQGPDSRFWNNCTSTDTYANGIKYVGEFKHGKRNGQGTFIFQNDFKYFGEFKDNNMHGQGTLISANGDKYVGEFKYGKRDGQGTGTFVNGDKYVGEFKDNKRNGEGTLYSSNGLIINHGMWADNTFVRSTTFTFQQATTPSVQQSTAPNTEIEKQSNLPLCQGIYSKNTWTNCFGIKEGLRGEIYIGEFVNNTRSGRGIQYSARGDVLYSGIWKNNNFETHMQLDAQQFAFQYSNQTPIASNIEIEKLRAEAVVAKRKQAELEEQLRLSQQQPQTNTQTVSAPSIGRRVALVVGNANYKVRPLKNPRNDADDISRSLRSSGFEVIDLRDASLQQMRNGVRQFGDRLINNDVGLVYYSGHGVEVKGRNYFIPVNADIMREDEITDQGLDVSLILARM